MKSYEVVPLQGVGPVALGMSRSQVREAMGGLVHSFQKVPNATQPTDAWHDNAFQVFYSAIDETAEFIELSRGHLAVMCAGVDVFNMPAQLVVKSIERMAPLDTSDPEHGYSFVFPSLELSFWRPVIEGSEGYYFSTVGIGQRGYFSGAA